MKIQTILDSIDLGAIVLTEFQRGYAWNQDQFRSLYHHCKDEMKSCLFKAAAF